MSSTQTPIAGSEFKGTTQLLQAEIDRQSRFRGRFERWATTVTPSLPMACHPEASEYVHSETALAWATWQAACEVACAEIAAADEISMKADYMLDSDDCIAVIRCDWDK